MRFEPDVSREEYERALRAEVAARFGEQRASAAEAQIESAADALRLVAEVEVAWTAEDPFYLGTGRRG